MTLTKKIGTILLAAALSTGMACATTSGRRYSGNDTPECSQRGPFRACAGYLDKRPVTYLKGSPKGTPVCAAHHEAYAQGFLGLSDTGCDGTVDLYQLGSSSPEKSCEDNLAKCRSEFDPLLKSIEDAVWRDE
ncbi:MAG: hypothetical protein V1729_05230 [Candidatus Woesearchaeota archaeon]